MTDRSVAKPPRRWWPGGVILALGITLSCVFEFGFADNSALQNAGGFNSRLFVGVILVGWLVFFSPLAWPWRRRLGLAALVLLIGTVGTVRWEGCEASNKPVFAWRWTPRRQMSAPAQVEASTADLTRTSADDWPQFMGPNHNLQLAGPKLARDWQAQPPKELWRREVGLGWSSFAVVGDYALTQEEREGAEWTICYRKLTGEIVWTHQDPGTFANDSGGGPATVSGDGPRCTPTIYQGRVYTLGSFGRLNCLDGASGKPIWYRQIIDPVKDKTSFPMWGKSGSPVIVDGRVIVSAGVPPDHSLEAYDAASGDLVWHAGSALSAYDAPALMVLDGVPQLVIVNSVTVDSHDPNTGKLLWSTEWKGTDPKVAQPVAVGDRGVYVGAAYGYGSRLFDVARQGDAWLVTERWHSMKLKPKINNVIVRNGFAYGLDDGRGLVCIELEKGTMKWRSGRFGYGQILAVDELLLVQAESGEVALVEFSPDGAHELTRFEALSSKTWNQPILAGRYLLVRNDQQAACFELPVAE